VLKTEINPLALAKGMATFVPGIASLALRSSGGTNSARYCYGVWLCHLIKAAENGLPIRFKRVAELGPGDSLGIGLASMLTGADHYLALDAKPHASSGSNIATFEELVQLFSAEAAIPGHDEFPNLQPLPTSLEFPRSILTPEILRAALNPDRLDAIRRTLQGEIGGRVSVKYLAPWDNASILEPEVIDLAFSQAVLEHVEDIGTVYRALYRWLKPGAVMSHAIDFKSHGVTRSWYGHWTLSDLQWFLVKGRRAYLINREPLSSHLAEIRRAGFEIITTKPTLQAPPSRGQLSPRFCELSDDDLRSSSVFLQARKPTTGAELN
jgi:hypothetical protein